MPNYQRYSPYLYLTRLAADKEDEYRLFVAILHWPGEEVSFVSTENANGTTLLEYRVTGNATSEDEPLIYYDNQELTNLVSNTSSVQVSCLREEEDLGQPRTVLSRFCRLYLTDADTSIIPDDQNIAYHSPYLFLSSLYSEEEENIEEGDQQLISVFDPYCLVPLSEMIIDLNNSRGEAVDGSYIQNIVLTPPLDPLQNLPEFIAFGDINANVDTYSETGIGDGFFETEVIVNQSSGDTDSKKGRIKHGDADTDNNDFVDTNPLFAYL